MPGHRSSLPLFALLTAEVLGLLLLHSLGAEGWAQVPVPGVRAWLATVAPADAVAALARVAALVALWWVTVTTGLAVAARLAAVPAAARAGLDRMTLPVVRRVVERALAVALVSGLAVPSGGVALAASRPPVAAVAVVGQEAVTLPRTTSAPLAAVAVTAPGLSAAIVRAPAAGRPSAPAQVVVPGPPAQQLPGVPPLPAWPAPETATAAVEQVVSPGDNLWALSAARVEAARGRHAGDREVHAYWVLVLAANRDGLRSGDVDLIHVGERVMLPPVPPG